MRNIRFFAALLIFVFCLAFAVAAEEAVVYVDGTNYTTLAATASST